MKVDMVIFVNHEEVRRAKNEQDESSLPMRIPQERYKTVPYNFRLSNVVDCFPDGKGRLVIGFPHKEITVVYSEKVHKTIQSYIDGFDGYSLIHIQ